VVRSARVVGPPAGARLIRPSTAGLVAALGALALAGCGEVQPQVALPRPVSPEPAAPPAPRPSPTPDRSLEGLARDDQRVADVSFRLATANAELCSDIAPLTGLVLQSGLEYRPGVRSAADAMFHMGDRPQVEVVAAGSPAAAAGVLPGDVVLAVNGAPLPVPAPDLQSGDDTRPATDAPVAEAQQRLEGALATGPARLRLLRDGAAVEATLRGQEGCAYAARVFPDGRLTASADGRQVFVSTAMVGFADTDARLALVLGHELAHDLLHHRARLDRAGFARPLLGPLGDTPASVLLTEKEADYVGLYLVARAGYDIAQAPEFWRTFPASAADFDWTHPSISERVAALTATRNEIERKRAAGAALTPEFLPGAER
jgi:Zn-dependent protease with chaperone function